MKVYFKTLTLNANYAPKSTISAFITRTHARTHAHAHTHTHTHTQ